jgi:DNA-binding transcriptional LysR family regulator
LIVELRQLKYFIAVAEELNFTRAAKRVHVSQPPLSRQIRQLERDLGFVLLERTQHRVALTDAGRAFYEQVKRALEFIEGARRAAALTASGEVGQLAIGFGGSAAYSFLPHVLRSFKTKFPLVHLTLEPIATSAQLEAIRKNRIDVGILMRTPIIDEDDINSKLLLRDRMVVALPEGHRLARNKHVALSQLADENFITFSAAGYRSHLIEMCRRSSFAPNIVQEAPQAEPMIGLVAAGVGVAIVATIAQRVRLSEVQYRPISDRHAVAEFVVAWRKTESSAPVREFLSLAQKAVHDWASKTQRSTRTQPVVPR